MENKVRNIRSVISQFPAIVISLAALVLAAGGGVGYAASAVTTDTDSVAMHTLPLGQNWQGSLRYGLNDGVVYLAGKASKSTGPYSCMTTLPAAARPVSRQLDIIDWVGANIGTIQVLNTGQVCPRDQGGVSKVFLPISLAGISFPTTS